MDNTPKKLNPKLLASLIALEIIIIGYCVILENTDSIDAQINVYTENTTSIIYFNESDMGITTYNYNGTINGCSLINGCFSRPMVDKSIDEPEQNITIRNNDLIL
jgi:hypothetical protein